MSKQQQVPTMQLGKSTEMPVVGLGTYLMMEKTAECVVTALKAGYRCFDSAKPPYNEPGCGEGLKRGMDELKLSRDDVFVTTKVWPGNPAWGMAAKSASDVAASLQESLANLQLEHVDLLLIHAPFCSETRLEQWRALVELKKGGKAKAVGVSNYNVAHLEEIRKAGLPMPDANQLELHPWCQKPDMAAYHKEHGIATIAYSSLVPMSEWRASDGADQRKALTEKVLKDGAADQAAFKAMAKKYGVTEAQILLKWALQKGFAVIPKAMSEERMKQNLDLFSFEIDKADMAAMEKMDKDVAAAWGGNGGDPYKSS